MITIDSHCIQWKHAVNILAGKLATTFITIEPGSLPSFVCWKTSWAWGHLHENGRVTQYIKEEDQHKFLFKL